jgi:hypothetical protein
LSTYAINARVMGHIKFRIFVISGFRRDVHDICTLLGCYAASSVSSVPTFRDKVLVPSSRILTLEDGAFSVLKLQLEIP